MSILQRCVFVEGIGRCHVLSSETDIHVAAMDVPQSEEARAASRACDIIMGQAPGRLIWSVRIPLGVELGQ